MREKCTAQRGFTLIELLVVIAIIAILAAIIFPVFNKVREDTRRTKCMQQMHDIGTAVKVYREDMGKYPPVLSSYSYYYDNTTKTQLLYDAAPGHSPLDIDQIVKRSLSKQKTTVTGKETFLCPDNVNPVPTAVTNAIYPPNVPLSGQVTILNEKQVSVPAYFYTYDSYDVGPALDANYGATPPFNYELHYSLDWTGKVGPNDPQNQLKYPNPPESSTVITWCSYHAAVNHSDIIPVLMLSGNVKPVAANQFGPKGPLKFAP